jgi:hypothetical protein
MTASASSLPKNLRIGVVLVIIAGAVPFIVGGILFVLFVISVGNSSQPWLAARFPPSPASYSLNDIRTFNVSLGDDFVTAQHIELANATMNAFLIALLAIFGLRRYQKWSWYAILIALLWVGINDTWAMIAGHQFPTALIPISVGVIGLFIARSSIFGRP